MKRARVSRRELRQALKLYQGFRERDLGKLRRVRIEEPTVLAHIGRIRSFEYETTHGDKPMLYRHDFAAWARPEFHVSPSGRQIFILPGNYIFTARGIVDRRRR